MSAGAGAHGGWLRRVKLTEVAGRGRTCRRAPNPRPSPRSLRSFRLSPSCNHMQSHAIPVASIESLPRDQSRGRDRISWFGIPMMIVAGLVAPCCVSTEDKRQKAKGTKGELVCAHSILAR